MHRMVLALVATIWIAPSARASGEVPADVLHDPYPDPAAESYGPEGWAGADTAYQATFLALLAIDWRQTLSASSGSGFYETNRLLGPHPPASTVNSAFLTVACLHTLAAFALPPRYRRAWQAVAIGFQASSVAHNFMVGAGFAW